MRKAQTNGGVVVVVVFWIWLAVADKGHSQSFYFYDTFKLIQPMCIAHCTQQLVMKTASGKQQFNAAETCTKHKWNA